MERQRSVYSLALPLSKRTTLSRIICRVFGNRIDRGWLTVEGGAPQRPTNVPRSPRLAGARTSIFLLAENGTGRFKRHDLRHIPARRFLPITNHFLLITSPLRPWPRSRTPSRRRNTPRRGRWPWSSCGCCCSRRSSSWRSCRRWCYRRCGCTCRSRCCRR